MGDLKFSSLNVRGLGEVSKRKEIFNWLRKKKFSIYMLQEVHCTEKNIHLWTAEWGYKALFSCCASNKAGTCILFNNNFHLQITKTRSDPNGRFIICDICTNGKNITLCNLYAPNEDKPDFFRDIAIYLQDFQCDEIIIGGDFNLVMDVSKDKKGGRASTHKNSLEEVKGICETWDVVDIWRVLNPEEERYTWRQKNLQIQCRLDFLLISQSLINNVNTVDIVPGYKTDHSMVTMEITTNANPRGPGFWKLNTSFLSDTDYISKIKDTIQQTKNEYSNNPFVSPALLWEMIKLKVRESSLYYSKERKKKSALQEDEIERTIAAIEIKLEDKNIEAKQREELLGVLKSKKDQHEKIIEYRTKGAILRSQCRWHNEGEKNTKYFLNLEKRHYKQGTISQLKTDNDIVITTDKDILKECLSFYKNLYETKLTSEQDPSIMEKFFPAENTIHLSQEEQNLCEGPLTEKECLTSLKQMADGKTPGTDGLPAEFYKIFWDDISGALLAALNFAYENGQLAMTQRRGIIKLIPKKEADLKILKNWRPLSLLNCDYKIAAKSIANRIQSTLPKLINNDQTGFIKGRFIGENIRLIDSIINYTNDQSIPGLILLLDFEKAFDTLEWSFVEKTLQHYGFGPSIQKWIQTLYCDIESGVMNNGWMSECFKIERGVRQGCPLSPYLFVLSVEVLASAIRSDQHIKGISVNQKEIKLSQYADDTTLILDGSKDALETSLDVIGKFSKISGLRLNNKKTEALWIGSKARSQDIMFPEKGFRWQHLKIKTLGVWLSIEPELTVKLNFNEKKEKVRNLLRNWQYRRLSLLGKIAILKSLIASQLVHVLSPLPTNHQAIKELNGAFYHFLWDGKPDKIKRNIMINDYSNGGLKMIDLFSFNKSLKTIWIKKYLDKTNLGKWKLFFERELGRYGGEAVFLGNLNKTDMKHHFSSTNIFINEILMIWSEVNYTDNISSLQHYQSQPLWNNSLIRIDSKPIYFREWLANGISTIRSLMKDANKPLSYEEFQNKYGLKACPLAFGGIIATLKNLRKRFKENIDSPEKDEIEPFIKIFLKAKKPSNLTYKILVATKSEAPETSQAKWHEDCDLEKGEFDWKRAFQSTKICTKSTKLIIFQFKFLHRRLPTNSFLYKINVKDSDRCSFCEKETETLLHLFWHCNQTTRFWESFFKWLQTSLCTQKGNKLDMTIALGLKPDTSNAKLQINFSCLMSRYCIWICKLKNEIPNLSHFLHLMNKSYEIEKNDPNSSSEKWKPLLGHLSN